MYNSIVIDIIKFDKVTNINNHKENSIKNTVQCFAYFELKTELIPHLSSEIIKKCN